MGSQDTMARVEGLEDRPRLAVRDRNLTDFDSPDEKNVAVVSRGKMRLIHTDDWKWKKPTPKGETGDTYNGMAGRWCGDSWRVEARRLLKGRRGIGRGRATVESNASQMCNQLRKGRLDPDLGVFDLGDVRFETLDAFQTRLSCQSSLSRGFLEETFKTGISTAPAWRVIGALASHFLFSASILRGDKRHGRG